MHGLRGVGVEELIRLKGIAVQVRNHN